MLANLNDVLLPARREKYAVGLFNTLTLEMARAVIDAAEKLHSPVIVGTAEVLLPSTPLENVADMLIPMARRAQVPVVVHYDHGLTFDKCVEAVKLGFTSLMYDCSTDGYEENLRKVAELTRFAHAAHVTVEAELGHVGEGDAPMDNPSDFYTDPQQAKDFVTRTGVDALAIAVGTAHGAYTFTPKLDFERIQTIAATISVPLVLHGGSGLTDEDFRRATQCGISKVNIFTDINVAAARGVQQALEAGKGCMTDMIPYQLKAIMAETEKKMQLFGSVDRYPGAIL